MVRGLVGVVQRVIVLQLTFAVEETVHHGFHDFLDRTVGRLLIELERD